MPFGSLWIQVIVSTVVVFVASSILHMVLKYHRADFRALPNEDGIRDAIAKGNASPGLYLTPYCSDPKQMKDPAIQEKYVKGPVALITVYPKGPVVLPKLLGLWFGLCFLVSF